MAIDAGIVSAYGFAVAHGYTGTPEQFGEDQANFAANAQQVREDKETVEELVESIPPDYTTMVEAVDDITEATSQNGNFIISPGTGTSSAILNVTSGSNANTASGDYSYAEGFHTSAAGANSHAEGDRSTASGESSHAEGTSTTASGRISHAEGLGTIANHVAQRASGAYNVADPSTAAATAKGNYIEIVGNGTSNSNRSNARTLDWSGNEVLAGNLTASGGSITVGQTTFTENQLSGVVAAPAMIAPAYSATNTYAVGDYVTYNDALYRCKTAISTAEAWTAAHWEAAKVGPDLKDLKSSVNLENEYGVNLTLLPITSINNYYGITVAKVNSNTYRVSGTATATINVTIGTFQQVNGKTYHFRNNASTAYTSSVYIYLYGADGTNWIKTDYNWTATETKDIAYRLYVGDGQTVDFTIQPLYYTNESNIDLDTYAKATREQVDQIITYNPHYNMEFGSIALSNNPPAYGNSNSRVRTMEKVTIQMAKNDVISVDTTGIVFAIGWKNRSGQWRNSNGWVTKYTLPEDGDAVIVARYSTETTIASVDDISSHIIITRHNSLYGEYGANVIKNKRRNFFIKTISHRGFSRYAPENTLIAYKLSSYMGFDAVETDVRFTSDGVPVLLHDATINRTARNADGTTISDTINIADITYEQALTYDFGIHRGTQFAGTKIPTFEEFIILCKKLSLKPYVEIKDGTGTHISDMYNIVKKCAMLKNTTWVAYSWTDLEAMKNTYSSARIGLIGDMTSSTITTLNSLKTDDNEVFMNADISHLTSQNILDLIDADIPLEVFTINSITTANNLDPYISGIATDFYNLGYEIYSLNMDDVFGTRTVVIQ